VGSTNGGLVSQVLGVGLDTGVVEGGLGGQVAVLGTLVLCEDSLLLVVVEHEEFLLFGGRQALVCSGSLLDFTLEDGEKGIVLVFHDTLAESLEGGLEELVLNSGTLGWVLQLFFDLCKGLFADV